jgi:hypothetical protein
MRTVVVNNANPSNKNVFGIRSDSNSYIFTEHFLEAVVVDVVVNDEHPSYNEDGYNVGSVKIRILKTQYGRDESILGWAFPIDSNVTDYPVIGEIVLVTTILNRMYYLTKINTSNRVTAGSFPELIEETSPSVVNKFEEFEKNKINPLRTLKSEGRLGNYFKDNLTTYRLKSFEGDIIYEGRFGQSIRFGSAQRDVQTSVFRTTDSDFAPNLIIRVGQKQNAKPTKNSPFGLILEDINQDLTSVWLVADQIIPITLSTVQNRNIHSRSTTIPSRFEGAQAVINTNQIILNTKLGGMYFHSYKGIHNTTLGDFTVDSAENFNTYIGKTVNLRSNDKFSIQSNSSILLGTNSSEFAEQMVLGNTLQNFLNELIKIFEQPFGLSSTGPVNPLPSVVAKLKILRNTYLRGGILSDNIYLSKTSSIN